MPTEGSSNEPQPQSVVETRNPAFVGTRHEERSARSISIRTASGSLRSSTTVSSSESQHTCPNCHKIVEILPATPHRFPSDFCRCNKAPGPPSSGATASDEPVSEATLQDAPVVADDSSSASAHSLTSGNRPPADQPIERDEQAPPPVLRFVPARLRQYYQTNHWCIYFGSFSFLIIVVIAIILILYYFSNLDSSSGDSKGVTIRGRPG